MDSSRGIIKQKDKIDSSKKGKNYLLAIGIDEYTHHPTLQNAVADANAFVQVLTKRYDFELLSDSLFNKKATQRNIRKAFGKCETLAEHDRLIVFYAGHGWYKASSNLGFLVPIDAEDDPHSDFIPVNFITNIFRGVQAHHILLIVDCCFGGSFGLERNLEQMGKKVISRLDQKKSRMVLSSGSIEPVSDGLVWQKNSPFSKPLIDFLKENRSPKIILSDVFPLLRKKTNWNSDQVPQYKVLQYLGHDDGELALFCNDLESPEEKAYRLAKTSGHISLLEKFIKDFRSSPYKPEIRNLLKEKRAEKRWNKIKNRNRIEELDEFIEEFFDSSFADLAMEKMTKLEIKEEPIVESTFKEKSEPKPIIPTIKIPKKLEFEPEMVLVEEGSFIREGGQKVTLSGYHIGKYPITQTQWETIMGNNPSQFKGNLNNPVEKVSWEDCQLFLEKLNKKSGKKYRLPTEAEWEFAARGGNQSKGFEYSGSNNLRDVGWYHENAKGKTHPVGQKKANELGIYDMSGNVWEWCQDWYGDYSKDDLPNPTGVQNGSYRVIRGGSWNVNAVGCRSVLRYYLAPADRYADLGFRVVSSLQ